MATQTLRCDSDITVEWTLYDLTDPPDPPQPYATHYECVYQADPTAYGQVVADKEAATLGQELMGFETFTITGYTITKVEMYSYWGRVTAYDDNYVDVYLCWGDDSVIFQVTIPSDELPDVQTNPYKEYHWTEASPGIITQSMLNGLYVDMYETVDPQPQDPMFCDEIYVVITYEPIPGIAKVNGVLWENLGKFIGVSKANIAKINGVVV